MKLWLIKYATGPSQEHSIPVLRGAGGLEDPAASRKVVPLLVEWGRKNPSRTPARWGDEGKHTRPSGEDASAI
jgi:hypothetical protein